MQVYCVRDVRLARIQTSTFSEHANVSADTIKFIDREPHWYARKVNSTDLILTMSTGIMIRLLGLLRLQIWHHHHHGILSLWGRSGKHDLVGKRVSMIVSRLDWRFRKHNKWLTLYPFAELFTFLRDQKKDFWHLRLIRKTVTCLLYMLACHTTYSKPAT